MMRTTEIPVILLVLRDGCDKALTLLTDCQYCAQISGDTPSCVKNALVKGVICKINKVGEPQVLGLPCCRLFKN